MDLYFGGAALCMRRLHDICTLGNLYLDRGPPGDLYFDGVAVCMRLPHDIFVLRGLHIVGAALYTLWPRGICILRNLYFGGGPAVSMCRPHDICTLRNFYFGGGPVRSMLWSSDVRTLFGLDKSILLEGGGNVGFLNFERVHVVGIGV